MFPPVASTVDRDAESLLAVGVPDGFEELVHREAIEIRMADACGALNTAHAALTRVLAEALDEGTGLGFGLHTPAQWVAWRAGCAPSRAADLVRVAQRRADLPALAEGLDSGLLSLDQAIEVAKHVPVGFDRAAVEFAQVATVAQLRYALPRHAYLNAEERRTIGAARQAERDAAASAASAAGMQPEADPATGSPGEEGSGRTAEVGRDGGSGPDGPRLPGEPARAEDPTGPAGAAEDDTPEWARDPSVPVGGSGPIEEERRASWGNDERGWFLTVRMPADEGAVIETALRAKRDELIRRFRADQTDGGARHHVTNADAVLALAEAGLAAGEARWPGSDRFLVHAHLETNPATATLDLTLHQGPVLPDHLRRLLTCDGRIRPVFEQEGTPVGIGRTSRTIPRRLRRLVEHRDGGCAVPGCGRTWGTQLHHIWHWEDGGPTDLSNLLTLCTRHHRQHHLGLLGISGCPDRATGTEPLRFTDRYGRPMPSVGAPRPPDPSTAGATRAPPYVPPVGERCDWSQLLIGPNPPPRPPPSADLPPP